MQNYKKEKKKKNQENMSSPKDIKNYTIKLQITEYCKLANEEFKIAVLKKATGKLKDSLMIIRMKIHEQN